MNNDTKAQQAIEETGKDKGPVGGQELPVAGPHAAKHRTDESKTPGTGALPDRETKSSLQVEAKQRHLRFQYVR